MNRHLAIAPPAARPLTVDPIAVVPISVVPISVVLLAALFACGCSESPPRRVTAPQTTGQTTDPTVLILREPVDRAAWKAIAPRLPNLTRLEIHDPAADLDWAPLRDAASLTLFRLNRGGENDLIAILPADSLSFLNLPRARCDAAAIARLHSLTGLRLGGVAVDATAVAAWPPLSHLHLLDTELSDTAVEAILAHDSLASLYLDRVTMSETARERLLHSDLHLHLDQLHPDRTR